MHVHGFLLDCDSCDGSWRIKCAFLYIIRYDDSHVGDARVKNAFYFFRNYDFNFFPLKFSSNLEISIFIFDLLKKKKKNVEFYSTFIIRFILIEKMQNSVNRMNRIDSIILDLQP